MRKAGAQAPITLEPRKGKHGTLWFVRWRGALEPIAFTRKADAQAFADLLQAG